MVAGKTCKACGETKALEDFYRERLSSDGHQGVCRVCKREDARLRRAGIIKPYVPNGVDQPCSVCGKVKPLDQFYADKAFKNGRAGHCKACKNELTRKWREANRPHVNAVAKAWRVKNPDSVREKTLKHLYGIGIEDYEARLKAQRGKCAICGTKDPKGNIGWCNGGRKKAEYMHVDHDHESGEVRGLLCANCNKALGCFGDDPKILAKAITYLKQGATIGGGLSVVATTPPGKEPGH